MTHSIEIHVKPLSVNRVWMGRRFKTKDYKDYEILVTSLLPADFIIPEGLLEVYYEFGMASVASDWDNPVKPFQDVLQKKYEFNDSRIVRATVHKVKVDKGDEYIRFSFQTRDEPNKRRAYYLGAGATGCQFCGSVCD